MNKSILAIAILALSTSGASAWTHHFHHRQAMNAYGSVAAPPAYGAPPAYEAYGSAAAPPFVGMGGVSNNDRTMYLRNLHDSGYDPKNDFTKSGTLVTQ